MVVTAYACRNRIATELFENNQGLVYFLYRKWKSSFIQAEHDDIRSLLQYAFWKACRTYDPSKQTRFSTYATRVMNNEVLMYIRGRKKQRRNAYVSLNDVAWIDPHGNPIYREEMLGAPQDFTESINNEVMLIDLMRSSSHLSEVEQMTIELALSGMTQSEFAKKKGLSQSYISRIVRRGQKKLQFRFAYA